MPAVWVKCLVPFVAGRVAPPPQNATALAGPPLSCWVGGWGALKAAWGGGGEGGGQESVPHQSEPLDWWPMLRGGREACQAGL